MLVFVVPAPVFSSGDCSELGSWEKAVSKSGCVALRAVRVGRPPRGSPARLGRGGGKGLFAFAAQVPEGRLSISRRVVASSPRFCETWAGVLQKSSRRGRWQ